VTPLAAPFFFVYSCPFKKHPVSRSTWLLNLVVPTAILALLSLPPSCDSSLRWFDNPTRPFNWLAATFPKMGPTADSSSADLLRYFFWSHSRTQIVLKAPLFLESRPTFSCLYLNYPNQLFDQSSKVRSFSSSHHAQHQRTLTQTIFSISFQFLPHRTELAIVFHFSDCYFPPHPVFPDQLQ